MSVRLPYMSYGSNMGLSRLWCRQCGAETLHKAGGICAHCDTRYESAFPQNKATSVHIQQMRAANEKRARAQRRAREKRLAPKALQA